MRPSNWIRLAVWEKRFLVSIAFMQQKHLHTRFFDRIDMWQWMVQNCHSNGGAHIHSQLRKLDLFIAASLLSILTHITGPSLHSSHALDCSLFARELIKNQIATEPAVNYVDTEPIQIIHFCLKLWFINILSHENLTNFIAVNNDDDDVDIVVIC